MHVKGDSAGRIPGILIQEPTDRQRVCAHYKDCRSACVSMHAVIIGTISTLAIRRSNLVSASSARMPRVVSAATPQYPICPCSRVLAPRPQPPENEPLLSYVAPLPWACERHRSFSHTAHNLPTLHYYRLYPSLFSSRATSSPGDRKLSQLCLRVVLRNSTLLDASFPERQALRQSTSSSRDVTLTVRLLVCVGCYFRRAQAT